MGVLFELHYDSHRHPLKLTRSSSGLYTIPYSHTINEDLYFLLR